MTANNLVKEMIISFNRSDKDSFFSYVRKYIEREKQMKHNLAVKELEKILLEKNGDNSPPFERRFRNQSPIPRDSEKGFPLLEIKNYDDNFEQLIVNKDIKYQLDQIIKEFNNSDILATYNLSYKKKILLCGQPGTGKTFTSKILSSYLNIPLVHVRFDSIISSYLGETASNLRKVFDYIQQGVWVVLFDEIDIIGKHRDDIYEHGEIKRVVNNFLQMLDDFSGASIIISATNHQYMLDSAIWRRFDDILYYELPSLDNRRKLFELYLKPLKRDLNNIDIEKFAIKSDELSPSDIKMIAEEAMKYSIIDSRDRLTNNDLEKALKKFLKREKLHKQFAESKNGSV